MAIEFFPLGGGIEDKLLGVGKPRGADIGVIVEIEFVVAHAPCQWISGDQVALGHAIGAVSAVLGDIAQRCF